MSQTSLSPQSFNIKLKDRNDNKKSNQDLFPQKAPFKSTYKLSPSELKKSPSIGSSIHSGNSNTENDNYNDDFLEDRYQSPKQTNIKSTSQIKLGLKTTQGMNVVKLTDEQLSTNYKFYTNRNVKIFKH